MAFAFRAQGLLSSRSSALEVAEVSREADISTPPVWYKPILVMYRNGDPTRRRSCGGEVD